MRLSLASLRVVLRRRLLRLKLLLLERVMDLFRMVLRLEDSSRSTRVSSSSRVSRSTKASSSRANSKLLKANNKLVSHSFHLQTIPI